MKNTKMISCSLDADLHRALMSAAGDRYTNASTIVRQALVIFLRDNNYLEPRSWAEQSRTVQQDVSKAFSRLG